MKYSNMKPLIKTFGFNQLEEVCNDHGWMIPTLDEARQMINPEYDVFWVHDKPPDSKDHATHALLYNRGKDVVEVCNKNHRHKSIVVRSM